MGSFMVAYRLTGEAKVKGVCEFVETLFDNGAKFLIFAHHQSVVEVISKFLLEKKIGHVRIDGKVRPEQRHERVKAFQEDPKVRCAVLSIMAASQGITLTAASTIVFAELTWTPSILSQAEDRAHRIGQKNSVNIYYMNGRGTVDDHIFSLLHSKSLITSDVTDGFQKSLNIDIISQKEIPTDEFANKDGTVQRRSDESSNDADFKQSMLEKFFDKKNTFNKKTKQKGPVYREEIDLSSSGSDGE